MDDTNLMKPHKKFNHPPKHILRCPRCSHFYTKSCKCYCLSNQLGNLCKLYGKWSENVCSGFTFGPVLGDDGYGLASVLQSSGSLLMRGHAQIHAVNLRNVHTTRMFTAPSGRHMRYMRFKFLVTEDVITLRIWSPLWSSPLRSAGPPARMKEINMPSPSSPPTMLKPRPVEPRWIKTLRGSLQPEFI